MSEKAEKIYCGSGRLAVVELRGGGSMEKIRLSFTAKDVDALKAQLNNAGWVNLDIMQRKHPSERGQTHYGVIDTWRPKSETAPEPTTAKSEPEDDNLPW